MAWLVKGMDASVVRRVVRSTLGVGGMLEELILGDLRASLETETEEAYLSKWDWISGLDFLIST